MRQLIQTLAILFFVSCTNTTDKDIIQGELYFGSHLRRLNRPGDDIAKLAETINNTDFADTTAVMDLFQETQSFTKQSYSKHFIDLLVDKDSIIRLQLDSLDFIRVSKFKYEQLRQSKKKVAIKVKIQKIEDGFYKCTDLLDLVVVDGKTQADKELEQQIEIR